MKALIIMDMTNDFVFEKYEHEGKEYEGRLVAPPLGEDDSRAY